MARIALLALVMIALLTGIAWAQDSQASDQATSPAAAGGADAATASEGRRWHASACGSMSCTTTAQASQADALNPSRSDGGLVTLTIWHINDAHGQTDRYPLLATLLGTLRPADPDRTDLLVHAGDEFSKGDPLTTCTLGRANIQLLNALGVDAMTPGNGEFYWGINLLRQRISEAGFPFLTANVTDAAGACVARPYAILPAGPLRVGVIGLCTVREQFPSAAGLTVEGAAASARRLVPVVREQADVVVVLSHLGKPADLKLAQAVDGIDLIIGGHSHTVMPQGQHVRSPSGEDVLVAQTGQKLEYLGKVQLDLKKTDGGYEVAASRAQLIAIDDTIVPDPHISDLRARLQATAPATQPALPEHIAKPLVTKP